MIRCENVSCAFDGRTVVDQVTLSVPAGAVAALLGPNGVGKSTILKMFTGMVPAAGGSMRVCGLAVPEKMEQVKPLMGVVPESLGLFESLGIEEHLLLCGEVYGIPATEARRRTEELLTALGLMAGRATPMAQCSYGMRKKTALALALIHNPRVLFLDEPFEGLDPISARAIEAILRAFAARGGAVLMTSHMLPTVTRCASHIWILRDGRVAYDSAAADSMRPLAEVYDELIPAPPVAELGWLRG